VSGSQSLDSQTLKLCDRFRAEVGHLFWPEAIEEKAQASKAYSLANQMLKGKGSPFSFSHRVGCAPFQNSMEEPLVATTLETALHLQKCRIYTINRRKFEFSSGIQEKGSELVRLSALFFESMQLCERPEDEMSLFQRGEDLMQAICSFEPQFMEESSFYMKKGREIYLEAREAEERLGQDEFSQKALESFLFEIDGLAELLEDERIPEIERVVCKAFEIDENPSIILFEIAQTLLSSLKNLRQVICSMPLEEMVCVDIHKQKELACALSQFKSMCGSFQFALSQSAHEHLIEWLYHSLQWGLQTGLVCQEELSEGAPDLFFIQIPVLAAYYIWKGGESREKTLLNQIPELEDFFQALEGLSRTETQVPNQLHQIPNYEHFKRIALSFWTKERKITTAATQSALSLLLQHKINYQTLSS